jgi:hypothetical protein
MSLEFSVEPRTKGVSLMAKSLYEINAFGLSFFI